jgi:hypothetical protein
MRINRAINQNPNYFRLQSLTAPLCIDAASYKRETAAEVICIRFALLIYSQLN